MLPYYPALRAKPGEFAACCSIARRFQQHICPRFVIPPPGEVDPEIGHAPTADELGHFTGHRIGKWWPQYPGYLDPQYWSTSLGHESVAALFRLARSRNSNLVPVLTIEDLHQPSYRGIASSASGRIGIYVDYERVDADGLKLLVDGVKAIGSATEQCTVFLDFAGAPLETGIGSVAAARFDDLGTAADWARIVFQASAYPRTLPGESGKTTAVERHEWTSFQVALRETNISPEKLGYGDFGADSGEMVFPKPGGGGRPERHLRYTTPTHILVVRGTKTGRDTPVMREVCRRVVEGDHFCGRGFSYADDRIWSNAHGLSENCGTATMWREWNTAHHLVHVVRQLGAISGLKFEDDVLGEFAEQGVLPFDTA